MPFPFEFYQDDRWHFHYSNWNQFRRQKQIEYPIEENKARIEVDLIFPREHRDHIPVHWNPHTHFNPYTCFCQELDWSVIFEPYPAHIPTSDPIGTPSFKLILEKGHQNPWGERVYLFSTASNLYDQYSIRYAYFRGQHWKILSIIWIHYPPIIEWFRTGEWIATGYLNYKKIKSQPTFDWKKEGF